MEKGSGKGHTILMVGDDGSVYQVKPGELGKIAKPVSREKLSADARAHIDEKTGTAAGGSGGTVSYIFASKADIFVSSKADIFVTSKADIFASGD